MNEKATSIQRKLIKDPRKAWRIAVQSNFKKLQKFSGSLEAKCEQITFSQYYIIVLNAKTKYHISLFMVKVAILAVNHNQ